MLCHERRWCVLFYLTHHFLCACEIFGIVRATRPTNEHGPPSRDYYKFMRNQNREWVRRPYPKILTLTRLARMYALSKMFS